MTSSSTHCLEERSSVAAIKKPFWVVLEWKYGRGVQIFRCDTAFLMPFEVAEIAVMISNDLGSLG